MGKKHTAETRAKISASKTGKPRLFSKTPDETRRKMRDAKLGNKYPLGHRHSDETRAKMRATWAKKRAERLAQQDAFQEIIKAVRKVERQTLTGDIVSFDETDD